MRRCRVDEIYGNANDAISVDSNDAHEDANLLLMQMDGLLLTLELFQHLKIFFGLFRIISHYSLSNGILYRSEMTISHLVAIGKLVTIAHKYLTKTLAS